MEQRRPCPVCGSLARDYAITLSDSITAHSQVALKAKTPGEKRPFIEQKVGDSYSVSRGRWMRLRQLIDRRHNRYAKKVEDPETGEVLRDVDEPLSEHTGRGSAKRR